MPSAYADSLGDINLAKADSPCNGITDGSFTVQNHVEVGTIDAVMLCKCALTSFSFNCGPQLLTSRYCELMGQKATHPEDRQA